MAGTTATQIVSLMSLSKPQLLPNGWTDLARQLGLWMGFAVLYELARASADRGPAVAFANADRLVALEHRLGGLYDLDVQRWTLTVGGVLLQLVNWTYWLSQFAVLAAGLIWVYLRHNHAYARLRNTLVAVNVIGLAGYVIVPTAPPRLLVAQGFTDTLANASLTFRSGLVHALANPDAAMPSLHATDALVLGVLLAPLARSVFLRTAFLLWPVWVSFALLASGNHYWLDVVAGAGLGAIGLGAARLGRPLRRVARQRSGGAPPARRPSA